MPLYSWDNYSCRFARYLRTFFVVVSAAEHRGAVQTNTRWNGSRNGRQTPAVSSTRSYPSEISAVNWWLLRRHSTPGTRERGFLVKTTRSGRRRNQTCTEIEDSWLRGLQMIVANTPAADMKTAIGVATAVGPVLAVGGPVDPVVVDRMEDYTEADCWKAVAAVASGQGAGTACRGTAAGTVESGGVAGVTTTLLLFE